MKQYKLNSTAEQNSFGILVVSEDYTVIEINIKPEQQGKYLGLVRRVISDVMSQGQFEVLLEAETMKINNSNKMLLQAITQSLIASTTIVPEEVQQILTSN